MLLEFRCKNFKTFREECVFSMEPASRQTGLDYSIISRTVGKRTHKALSCSVIYGPNAAGKSNLVAAMETMKRIVLGGNIKNSLPAGSPNLAAFQLELIPNRSAAVGEPVSFYIKFIAGGMLCEYAFAMDVGGFCVIPYDRSVVRESLKINGQAVIERSGGELSCPPKAGEADAAIATNLSQMDLFLTNGFRTSVNKDLANTVLSWFENRFMTYFASDHVFFTPNGLSRNEYAVMPDFQDRALQNFGLYDNAISYLQQEESEPAKMVSTVISGNRKIRLFAEAYESHGTLRFVNLLPCLLRAMEEGQTLIFDEMDVSLHPAAMLSVIDIFHNDEINKHGAQLIFNTHNPIFLDAEHLRRDEIKFIDRTEDGGSELYRLSDFGTKGGVRKTNSYMKNYFVNRYGAIRNIDFSELFKEAIMQMEEAK